jgi:hypothetical protein
LQRNPKLSSVFSSCAPLDDFPGVLLKMQPLSHDVQAQLFAEVALLPEAAARRPAAAIDWKETCSRVAGCSPVPPLLQGCARGFTAAQVLDHASEALHWLKFLTSHSLNFAAAEPPSPEGAITGLRNYSLVITTPPLDPAHHLLSVKLQFDGSQFQSVPQLIQLTPGASEHKCTAAVDDALGRSFSPIFCCC